MPIDSLFPSLNEALMPYFKYQTAKYILIEVPIVGIVNAAREQAEAKGASKRQGFAVRFPDTAANMAAQMRVAPRLGLSGGKGGDRKAASLIAQ